MTTKYLIDKFELEGSDLLKETTFGIDAGFQGVSRDMYDSYVLPIYELSKDIRNFTDDRSCPEGWGCGRHDQTLYSILARQLNLDIQYHDVEDCTLNTYYGKVPFHITHAPSNVNQETVIFRSRWNFNYNIYKSNVNYIKKLYNLSIITAIGPLTVYEKFIPTYFSNIQEQVNFSKIEFVIIYSEWSSEFDPYIEYPNIVFVKEDKQLGVYNAWNIGIQNATAEFISNWNVDDLRYPINTGIKQDVLRKNLEVDLVYNYYVATTTKQLEAGISLENIPVQEYPDDYHLHTHIACMAGPDPIWRKAFHTFYGLFDYQNYSIIADWEMWRRMSTQGMKMKLIPHVLCIYVDHEQTISNSSSIKLDEQKVRLAKQYTY